MKYLIIFILLFFSVESRAQLTRGYKNEGTGVIEKGIDAHAEGGGTEALGDYSHAGGKNSRAGYYGEYARASGCFSRTGDAQYSNLLLFNVTYDDTETELFLDGSSLRIVVPPGSALGFRIMITALSGDNSQAAYYVITGLAKTGSGPQDISFTGIPSINTIAESDESWDAFVRIDTANCALVISVKGGPGKSVRWTAFFEMVQIRVQI